jgi:hypothetical protein
MGSVCLTCVTRRNNEEGTLGYNRNLWRGLIMYICAKVTLLKCLYQASEWHCIYVLRVSILPLFLRYSIGLWNCPDSVAYFHCITQYVYSCLPVIQVSIVAWKYRITKSVEEASKREKIWIIWHIFVVEIESSTNVDWNKEINVHPNRTPIYTA